LEKLKGKEELTGEKRWTSEKEKDKRTSRRENNKKTSSSGLNSLNL
jgi:hypothetical protein